MSGEAKWERVEAAEHDPAVPGLLLLDELEVREPPGQRAERRPAFDPGQRRAEAVVDAAAERDVLRRTRPARSSSSAVSPHCSGSWFAAPRQVSTKLPGFDGLAVELEVLDRDPTGELHRAVEAQQLLDRVLLESRIVAQPGELVRVRSSAWVPLPIRFTVVSWPAM